MAEITTEQQVQDATRYSVDQAVEDLRTNMLASFAGSLATICRDQHALAGYPLSSVVPFMLDETFRPVVLIANIAEHTRNAEVSPKASIFLRERMDGGDVQKQWRICLVGDLLPVPEPEIEAIAVKYYQHYPDAKNYHRMHNFYFYRLDIKKYRIIMGFGDIRWVKGELAFEPCPFSSEERTGMIRHMNEDHRSVMGKYLRDAGVEVADNDVVTMCDIHQYGFVLRHRDELRFMPFSSQPTTALAVRQELVAKAQN